MTLHYVNLNGVKGVAMGGLLVDMHDVVAVGGYWPASDKDSAYFDIMLEDQRSIRATFDASVPVARHRKACASGSVAKCWASGWAPYPPSSLELGPRAQRKRRTGGRPASQHQEEAMKTIAVIAGLIALFGIAGTPDYVLEVERENESLRAQLFKARAATLACRDIQQSSQLARAE